jgi:putative membrane protein
MDLIGIIPHLLATLNATAAVLVSAGYLFIRNKSVVAHRTCMVSALAVSTVFMVFYLYYHAKIGNVPFAGQGLIRPLYFTILASHVFLAAMLFPLVLITAGLALRARIDRHRRLARWTLPIWLYVSVTGVIVYALAFHLFPGEGPTAVALQVHGRGH